MNPANQELDTRGLNCPLPIVKTRKILNGLQSGDTLRVIASDPGSVKDMDAFCQQTGHRLLDSQHANNEFVFVLQKH